MCHCYLDVDRKSSPRRFAPFMCQPKHRSNLCAARRPSCLMAGKTPDSRFRCLRTSSCTPSSYVHQLDCPRKQSKSPINRRNCPTCCRPQQTHGLPLAHKFSSKCAALMLPQISQDDIDAGSVRSTSTAFSDGPLGSMSHEKSGDAQRLKQVTEIAIGETLCFHNCTT